MQSTATPGVQAVVMDNGKVLWAANRGQARIRSSGEGPRPVKARTLFSYASFGKQILAAYTLYLVEQDRIDLDLPIGRYLGGSFPGGETVTTRMLLNHTAGYPDVYSSREVGPLFGRNYDPDRRWSFRELLPGIKPPARPGRRFNYSNTGYIVLLRLVDRRTPGSLSRALARFLSPAGVSSDVGRSVATMQRSGSAARRFANGYFGAARFGRFEDAFKGASTVPTDIYGSPFGDGAFAGTALAAARFLNSLFLGGDLLDRSTVKAMTRPLPSSGGYGLGSFRVRRAGATWQGHDGSYGGFTTAGFVDRKRGLTIFVAANKDDDRFDTASRIWKRLARTLKAHK